MDPGPLDDEGAHLAAAWTRDELHAQLLARTVQLAARTHPELLREALASVFDVSGLLAVGRHVQADMARVQSDVRVARDTVRDEVLAMRKDLERLRAEIDGLRWVVEQAQKVRRHQSREASRAK